MGEDCGDDTEKLINPLYKTFLPFTTVLLRRPGESPDMDRIASYTSAYSLMDGKATAYVCSRHICRNPTTDADQMKKLIGID